MSGFGLIYYISRYLVYAFCKMYFRLSITYHPSIDWDKNYLVVANHASFLDPPLLGVGMKKGVHFLAKYELSKVPIWGKLMVRKFGTVPVRRGKGDIQALKSIISLLKGGGNVAVFPEGTRTLDGKFRKPRPGIGMVAYQTQATILPVYIHNTFHAMPKSSNIPRPVKVSMHFGKPYRPSAYNKEKSKELYQEIAEEMMEKIKEISRSAPS